MQAETLVEELVKITQRNWSAAEAFKKLPKEKLHHKPSAERWSILECVEHLNRYGDFYIPEIKNRIENARFKKSNRFKTGLLGNYFAKSMLPKEKLNKMKTFKAMNPNNDALDENVLDTFIHQQKQLLQLLEKAKDTDLTKVKTAISLSKWIKLRLGDTFRVVIYHNWRHILQAEKVLNIPTL